MLRAPATTPDGIPGGEARGLSDTKKGGFPVRGPALLLLQPAEGVTTREPG